MLKMRTNQTLGKRLWQTIRHLLSIHRQKRSLVAELGNRCRHKGTRGEGRRTQGREADRFLDSQQMRGMSPLQDMNRYTCLEIKDNIIDSLDVPELTVVPKEPSKTKRRLRGWEKRLLK
jgi:hypothetical protein